MTDFLHDRVTIAVGTHYLIDGEIGRGGMAVVYRATDLRLHRDVAIKVLPPELSFNADVRARFLREAQTAAQLSHPHIVPIYAVDETEGLVYFVMGFVDGESLAARLAREPRLAFDEVARILREVADGLGYAHERGVVHRDVKPDNILLERGTGRAVVTDFGIARAAAESRLTVTGVAVGTPAYMSPEQALGESDIDGRSDIYSLGVVGYQMLTGAPPFRAANTPAMLMKHVSETPRRLRDLRPDVPPVLAIAVERSLAKRPSDRWASAYELRDALAMDASAASPWRAPSAPHAELDSVLPKIQLPGGVQVGVVAKLNKDDWRELRRQHKRDAREQKRAFKEAVRSQILARAVPPLSPEDEQASWRRRIERRVSRFRHSTVTASIGIPIAFFVGALDHTATLFLVPSVLLSMIVVGRAGRLWADGVSPFTALRGDWRRRLFGEAGGAALPGSGSAVPAALNPPPLPRSVAGAPPEVLAGTFGPTVRRAIADRAAVRDVVSKLSKIELDLLPPEMEKTADGLMERVTALAVMLHRLDADVSGTSLAQIDERIVGLQSETPTKDRDRHLALLQRQRTTLHELLERRRALGNQLESASLLLQNLKLDLFRLRSAGVESALGVSTSVTQEARALSRDIGHLLEAAEDVKKF